MLSTQWCSININLTPLPCVPYGNIEATLCESIDKSMAGRETEHIRCHSQPQVEPDQIKLTGIKKLLCISLENNYQNGGGVACQPHEICTNPIICTTISSCQKSKR